jgi:hypothetical protein
MFKEKIPAIKNEGSTENINESFNKFSEYERKFFEDEKPKNTKATKIMRVLLAGTFLVGLSTNCIAFETKSGPLDKLSSKTEESFKNEKKEQLRVLVLGTIDKKIEFEIDATGYVPNESESFEANEKTSIEDMDKFAKLREEATKKMYKIIIDGKEAKILKIDIFSDGGSHLFTTDKGNIFIAHPAATIDFDKGEPTPSGFGTSDGKDHTIQIKTNNLFNRIEQ